MIATGFFRVEQVGEGDYEEHQYLFFEDMENRYGRRCCGGDLLYIVSACGNKFKAVRLIDGITKVRVDPLFETEKAAFKFVVDAIFKDKRLVPTPRSVGMFPRWLDIVQVLDKMG